MNKQIEEMTKIIWDNPNMYDLPSAEDVAFELYNAGYRKASDVIDEINNAIPVKDFNSNEITTGYLWAIADVRKLLLKLQKKYESEGAE